MTNFEKIKNMNLEEFIDFLAEVEENSSFFDDSVCRKYCEYRDKRKNGCLISECPFSTLQLTLEKWLCSEE